MAACSSEKLTAEQSPMTELLIEISEDILVAEKTDAARFSRELLLLASIKLYEIGRLTSGRAAELAGLSRVQFLIELLPMLSY
jgi:predicted HTH domain antitoxin